jgi:hypothetical protein
MEGSCRPADLAAATGHNQPIDAMAKRPYRASPIGEQNIDQDEDFKVDG